MTISKSQSPDRLGTTMELANAAIKSGDVQAQQFIRPHLEEAIKEERDDLLVKSVALVGDLLEALRKKGGTAAAGVATPPILPAHPSAVAEAQRALSIILKTKGGVPLHRVLQPFGAEASRNGHLLVTLAAAVGKEIYKGQSCDARTPGRLVSRRHKLIDKLSGEAKGILLGLLDNEVAKLKRLSGPLQE